MKIDPLIQKTKKNFFSAFQVDEESDVLPIDVPANTSPISDTNQNTPITSAPTETPKTVSETESAILVQPVSNETPTNPIPTQSNTEQQPPVSIPDTNPANSTKENIQSSSQVTLNEANLNGNTPPVADVSNPALPTVASTENQPSLNDSTSSQSSNTQTKRPPLLIRLFSLGGNSAQNLFVRLLQTWWFWVILIIFGIIIYLRATAPRGREKYVGKRSNGWPLWCCFGGVESQSAKKKANRGISSSRNGSRGSSKEEDQDDAEQDLLDEPKGYEDGENAYNKRNKEKKRNQNISKSSDDEKEKKKARKSSKEIKKRNTEIEQNDE